MTSTIIRTKSTYRVQMTETVEATIRAIGKGQITAALVLWSINSQLKEREQLTEAQVQRVLNEIARRKWMKLTNSGHGVYHWS